MALDPTLRTTTPPTGVKQYLRTFSLVVGNERTGEGLNLSNFRVVFSVVRDSVSQPNLAQIQIFNLNNATERLIQKEYTRVVMRAGYRGTTGQIFDGQVTRTMRGVLQVDSAGGVQPGPTGIYSRRESPTDTYLYLSAQDGDTIFNYGMIHVTLSAGATLSGQLAAIEQAIRQYGGTVRSYVPPSELTRAMPRGQVLHGQVRDVLDDFCASIGATWSIQNNVVEIVPMTDYIRGNAIVLNSATGLVGQPMQTINGIEVRCLLNPYIVPGRAIKLDNKGIQQQLPPGGYTTIDLVNDLDSAGLYKVLYVKHSGDSRGNPWFTDVICIGIDQAQDPRSGLIRVWS